MARTLGLDIGDKRIGIAVSDPLGAIATPHSVYTRVGYGPDVRHLLALSQELEASLIVAGLPRNMDGSKGPQAQKAEAFMQLLREAGLKVLAWDERLTTVSAQKALIKGDMRREKRKTTVDKVAAALILQSYLDSQSNNR